MAGRLSEAWIDDLRSRVPLEEVVSEYVPLKPKGKRYWGCCPFHHEKTPSFSVDTLSQMYYCFGCHKGGTVYTFVMEMERLTFMEAAERLAERVHMEIPKGNSGRTKAISNDERERIYEVNTLAARFFHSLLYQPEGAQALTYLYKRGLNDRDIRRFGLGASPKGWDTLSKVLIEQGCTPEEMEKAGLIYRREGRNIDVFRERAIFPIIEREGRVVGFGGRAMGEAQPKYLNTGETAVFNKRRGLYCLNMARTERDEGHLVLVEGYMDTVSLRKYGVRGVVATLGTALTEEQVRLIKRYAPQVWISYDGDGAGQKAALRALELCEAQSLDARVVDYPAGMDPDDFIKQKGKDGFDGLRKYTPTQYRILRAHDGLELSTQEGMTEYAMRCCTILKNVKNPIERENHLRTLIQETGYAREVLLEQIGVFQQQSTAPARTTAKRSNKPSIDPDERMLLSALAHGLVPAEMFSCEDFNEGIARDIAEKLLEGWKPSEVLESIEDEELRNAAAYAFSEADGEERAEEARVNAAKQITALRKKRLDARWAELIAQINTVQDVGEKQVLMDQMMAISEQIDALDQTEVS